MANDTSLRRTFNQAAELYHQVRPKYPDALFDRLVRSSGLNPPAHLLEIGPGTGQATVPLARRGFAITAVELGSDLAAVARRELSRYPQVQIIDGAFEEVALAAHAFDLVYAATSFHWIDPAVQFTKPHALLKAGGHLAIIHTHHVSDERGDRFFHASQPVYDRHYSGGGQGKPILPRPSDVYPSPLNERLFRLTDFALFPMMLTYSAREYVQLLSTYSPTLALPEDDQRDFLADMEALINNDFAGTVAKHVVMTLTVAEPIAPERV